MLLLRNAARPDLSAGGDKRSNKASSDEPLNSKNNCHFCTYDITMETKWKAIALTVLRTVTTSPPQLHNRHLLDFFAQSAGSYSGKWRTSK